MSQPHETIDAADLKAMMGKRRSKYGSHWTTVNGFRFQSAKEARRYRELWIMEQAGEISELTLQREFRCVVNGKLVCKYFADSSYVEKGVEVIEDVKSPATRKNAVYRLKKRLVEALFGVEIKEV